MTRGTSFVEVKQRVSARLLDEPGVSAVGSRENRIIVYLESDDPGVRHRAERAAREVAPDVALAFEVTGRFTKQ